MALGAALQRLMALAEAQERRLPAFNLQTGADGWMGRRLDDKLRSL